MGEINRYFSHALTPQAPLSAKAKRGDVKNCIIMNSLFAGIKTSPLTGLVEKIFTQLFLTLCYLVLSFVILCGSIL